MIYVYLVVLTIRFESSQHMYAICYSWMWKSKLVKKRFFWPELICLERKPIGCQVTLPKGRGSVAMHSPIIHKFCRYYPQLFHMTMYCVFLSVTSSCCTSCELCDNVMWQCQQIYASFRKAFSLIMQIVAATFYLPNFGILTVLPYLLSKVAYQSCLPNLCVPNLCIPNICIHNILTSLCLPNLL